MRKTSNRNSGEEMPWKITPLNDKTLANRWITFGKQI
jgi:hypothetical protein